MLFFSLFLYFTYNLAIIIPMDKNYKNYKDYKLCKNCKHFLPTLLGGKYDIGNHYGKCDLYGKINLITGEIEHEHALIARKYDDMCGINGTNFENLDDYIIENHKYPL
jgi:hypothetical protein